jgi:protein-histidine pros-kinase
VGVPNDRADPGDSAAAVAAFALGEASFRSLLEAAPDAFVIADGAGRVALINARTEALFGHGREALIGRPVEDLLPQRFRAEHVHHRDAYTANPHARPMGAGLELSGLRADGSAFPVEVSLSPIRLDGQLFVISAIRDVSERKQAQATLRRQADLIDLAGDAILVRSPAGTIQQWNRGAEALYGWSRAEAIGQMIDTLLHTHVPGPRIAIEERLAWDGQWQGELMHTRRDGRQVIVESRWALVRDEQAQPTAVLEVKRDVTARRQAEAAARQAMQEAERANQAKSEFLSRMSHELRTPLNAVLGFPQLLELDPLSPPQQRSVGHILKAGRHLLDLINEVLDIARIESGQLALSPEPVRVLDVVHEAADLVRPLAAERTVSIDLEKLGADGSDFVVADRQRLKQVLLNLLANAVKYNQVGGDVTVTCADTAPGRVRIVVRDTGPGIPPERQAQLFAPFERLGAETSDVEGTGLGLALSKGLVEAMGGSLGFESAVGEGSTFWIDLQAARNPLTRAAEAAPVEAPALGTAVRTVLYIEDNLPNLELVEQILSRWPGLRVEAAMQGRLGLDLARQHQPDLILLDVHLPDLPGHEVLQQLQADPRTRDVPVIIVSADATPGQIERLLAAGARAYLTKPLDVRAFLQLVRTLLAMEPV